MFESHAIFLSTSPHLLYPRGGLVPGPGQGRPLCLAWLIVQIYSEDI